MHGRGATSNFCMYRTFHNQFHSSNVAVAHMYCTHPEDNEANFQCDHYIEEVKPFPSTADLPKNKLTEKLEEERLRHNDIDIDELPAKIKENFDTAKKLKFAVRTISASINCNLYSLVYDHFFLYPFLNYKSFFLFLQYPPQKNRKGNLTAPFFLQYPFYNILPRIQTKIGVVPIPFEK
ncbi:Protein CBG21120 [Caenorhabditis briggsae]|uniref:Protein CBG21120 n=1 Tax=Caenorhabditis briggsae TaxID=6238 RepID=A8XZF7_CAEBR|nr:Protein CBG21120 [Caenorhabditis briggsae]CAP38084.1 Protein CBG21120 [Caenorhabditis briggsae]